MKMRKYIIYPVTNISIYPPIIDDVDMRSVLKESIQTSSTVKNKTEYPNGLILNTESTIEKTIITTNWVIVKGVNGELLLAEPFPESDV